MRRKREAESWKEGRKEGRKEELIHAVNSDSKSHN
jgi:hypothetical protein